VLLSCCSCRCRGVWEDSFPKDGWVLEGYILVHNRLGDWWDPHLLLPASLRSIQGEVPASPALSTYAYGT
jgi:hypothetical protein